MTSTIAPDLLERLQRAGTTITTATTITPDPCTWCDTGTTTIRITADPADTVSSPLEQTECCAGCAPWLLTRALCEQADECARPIQIEVQA